MKKILKCILVFLPSIAFLIYVGTVILKPGYIINTDVTERVDVSHLFERYIYTYTDDVGESLSIAETQRIPLFYTIFSIFKITGLNDSYFVKIKLLVLFTFSIAAFVFTTSKLIKKITKGENNHIILLFSNIAGVYFVSNYWAANRIMHFFLFFASVALPLFFYFLWMYLFSEKRNDKYLALLLFSTTIFNATPHTFSFEAVIGVLTLSIYIVGYKQELKEKITRITLLMLMLLAYVFINFYWIAPYLHSFATPDKVLSKTIVGIIAKNATLLNNVKLSGYWLVDNLNYSPQSTLMKTLFATASYIPVLLTSLALILLVKKNRILATLLFLMLILSLFLASSTKTSLSFYYYIMFNSPFKVVGWLFREIEKFGLLTSYVYSVSITFVLCYVAKKIKHLVPLVILLISLMIVNLWYFNSVLKNNFSPQQIPSDYQIVNEYLEADTEESNVVWYPGIEKPSWSKTKDVKYVFTNLLSSKPPITTNSAIQYFLSYLLDYQNTYYIDVGKSLDLLGTKYLIFRKDGSPSLKGSQLEDALNMQPSLEKVLEADLLTIYRNKEFTGLSKTYTNKLVTNAGYGTLKKLDDLNIDTSNTLIEFTDKPSGTELLKNIYFIKDNEYIDAAINTFSEKFIFPWDYASEVYDGENSAWKKSSLEDKVHAESSYFFNFIGIFINQLDYNKGVLSIRDGLREISKNNTMGALFTPVFSEKKVEFDGKILKYKTIPKDLVFEWNSVQSEAFEVTNTKALKIELEENIQKGLIPHFKIFFFDSEMGFIRSFTLYPDRKGQLNNIVKVPENTHFAKFGIWTLSKNPDGGDGYSYKISNLTIKDVSNNTEPVDFAIKTNTHCTGRCYVFVRALKSPIGGRVQLEIDNSALFIDTSQSDELPTKYSWFNTGQVEVEDDISSLKLTNIGGFNSINAIVLLNDFEIVGLDREIQSISNIGEGKDTTEEKNNQVSTIKINPTKYIVRYNSQSKPFILGFAKPYSKNWKIDSSQTLEVNGLINGWEINNPRDQEQTIEFIPQRYFQEGVLVSSISAVLILAYISIRLVIDSARKSNSQG